MTDNEVNNNARHQIIHGVSLYKERTAVGGPVVKVGDEGQFQLILQFGYEFTGRALMIHQ